MQYTQDCTENPTDLATTRAHVIAHLSSVASSTDDPDEYAGEVELHFGTNETNDLVRITGTLDRAPNAPYIRSLSLPPRQLAVEPDTLADLIQKGLSFYGVPWKILPGARLRGNGQVWGDVAGCIMHHTATPIGPTPRVLIDGRTDLSGPLCNSAGEADGTVAFVAYYPANHAGAGAGNSMGPLPRSNLFNKLVWGHEIVYPGKTPMTDAQYRSAVILGHVIAEILGGDVHRIRAHAETSSTGKWDPGYANGRTISMSDFRTSMTNLENGVYTQQQRDDLLGLIYTQLAGHGSRIGEFKGWQAWDAGSKQPNGAPVIWTVVDYMRGMDVHLNIIKAQLALLAQGSGLDIDETAIVAALKPVLVMAIRDAIGEEDDELADSIIQKLGAKLAS